MDKFLPKKGNTSSNADEGTCERGFYKECEKIVKRTYLALRTLTFQYLSIPYEMEHPTLHGHVQNREVRQSHRTKGNTCNKATFPFSRQLSPVHGKNKKN